MSKPVFPGMELPAPPHELSDEKIKRDILRGASGLVRQGFHPPIFFAFFPEKCHVFYLVDKNGQPDLVCGPKAMKAMVEKFKPYKVALVTESIITLGTHDIPDDDYEFDHQVLSIHIEGRARCAYSMHLLEQKDGARSIGACLFDTESREYEDLGKPSPFAFYDVIEELALMH